MINNCHITKKEKGQQDQVQDKPPCGPHMKQKGSEMSKAKERHVPAQSREIPVLKLMTDLTGREHRTVSPEAEKHRGRGDRGQFDNRYHVYLEKRNKSSVP